MGNRCLLEEALVVVEAQDGDSVRSRRFSGGLVFAEGSLVVGAEVSTLKKGA